ncbi:MAG: serine/threonine-protein kinase [Nanoarchaeota archaeon]|nr:serine/threonine protein kinase [Nanoarchaeota archaeon]MBU1030981.1 serine/threonine protein kinase [Nanoarchaeota archaeon]MBU1849892.1 serine/threonine protein kinase [Nanoarchaeota archaeon]
MKTINNYEIIKQISEGGFGRIYQARHKELDELACLKQNINATLDDVALLKNEAKILWKLDEYHSIPAAKDFFSIGKNDYVMVMSYIDGQTTFDFVENNSNIHPEDVCWITERLLGALHYIHYNGVIHSDVKPQNVIVEPKKHDIKLIDFGLSTYNPQSKTRPTGYTELYAAPELLQGKPPVPETDLYGAGIVMLYALGGDVKSKSLPKNVPKEIADFCNQLLVFDPQKRPCWEKTNLIEELSDIRQHVFGRKHVM